MGPTWLAIGTALNTILTSIRTQSRFVLCWDSVARLLMSHLCTGQGVLLENICDQELLRIFNWTASLLTEWKLEQFHNNFIFLTEYTWTEKYIIAIFRSAQVGSKWHILVSLISRAAGQKSTADRQISLLWCGRDSRRIKLHFLP